MMLRIMSVEFLKLKRKLVWLLVLLGPFGVIALQAVNFGLRYDYLTQIYAEDLWGGLIHNVSMLMLPTLFIGLTILASMTAGIDHQMNAWKQTMALPVGKARIFFGKFAVTAILLLCSSTLLVPFTVALGILLGFGVEGMPIVDLMTTVYYPFLAIMPFVALQVGLSVIIHNQALPLTVGIIGMIAGMFASQFPDWMPWKWPYLINAWDLPLYSVGAGLALGLIVLLLGMYQFVRKDVR
ncbi:ABC transporter permease [Paenibacillus sp. MCAF20]